MAPEYCPAEHHTRHDSIDIDILSSTSKICVPLPNPTRGKYTISSYLIIVAISLSFLVKHMEQLTRVLFLWRLEVEEESTCAEDMRRRNEALVYNILPPHVAAHFLGNRKRQHDELYSQSYSDVGVLFASMPNFTGNSMIYCYSLRNFGAIVTKGNLNFHSCSLILWLVKGKICV
ncbi:hypothetical protein WA026_022887 [Henosepilachna vigintioctopunctata]|uniref:Uncharacterized protein n=1 Tax=Henosepilachna vigintioctopunctata TaxID=420089 RepID=A0AAW1UFN2_9CUCU